MKKNIMFIVLGIVMGSASVVAGANYLYNAKEVSYNDTNVESAINDLYDKTSNNVLLMTPLIPTMTSNTLPSGQASASREVSGYEAYKALDNNEGTYDYWSDNSYAVWSDPTWFQYKFDTPKCAKMLVYKSLYSNIWYAKDFQILASNDGNNWTTLFEGDINDGSILGYYRIISLNNNKEYLYYRMNFLSSNGGNMMLNLFQLYE